MSLLALDCMGFAGGFSLGVVQAGFELVGKREMPGGFGVANMEANRHLLGHGWETQIADAAEWEPRPAHLLFGNPPCSGFSLMSSKAFRGIDSPINHCMHAFAEFAARVNPYVAVFESVRQAFTTGRELMQRLHANLIQWTGEPWTLYHVMHNCATVGGSPIRNRYFWVASRIPFGIEMPEPRRMPTLMETIGDLRDLETTWEAQPYRHEASWWAHDRRSRTGAVDGHYWRQNTYTRRCFDLVDVAGPWGPREPASKLVRRYHERTGTFPESWMYMSDKILARDFDLGWNQLVRWDGDAPARVVTGAGPMIAIHPTELRTLTHREVARIMGFPDAWRIHPLRNRSGLGATWGKGIPVDSGRWIAKWIRRALEGSPGSVTGERLGEAEFLIDASKASNGETKR